MIPIDLPIRTRTTDRRGGTQLGRSRYDSCCGRIHSRRINPISVESITKETQEANGESFSLYIGKHGVPNGRDQPLVVDWRTADFQYTLR